MQNSHSTARVVEVHRTNFILRTEGGDFVATVRGSFHDDGEFPKVGDYVTFSLLDDEEAVIEKVLPRSSVITRKAASSDETQIIATNVDIIFIVMGLDGDFNLSRLERYLVLAEQAHIQPVVILNKKDVTETLDEQVSAAKKSIGSTSLHVVSALTGDGMDELMAYFEDDGTAVLLGSSGAGKSTITNWLLGEDRQAVNDTREDDSRGRHTTTSRELFSVPGGGYIIDTPGMRELGLVELPTSSEESLIARIEELAAQCQFRNCDHEKSVGCAVMVAIEKGELTQRELHNYQKLMSEQEFLQSKESKSAARHYAQNQKRLQQKYEQIRRQRLSRR